MRNLLLAGSVQTLMIMLYSSTAAAAPVPSIPSVPAGEVGMLAMVSAAVAGGIWLARRKQ